MLFTCIGIRGIDPDVGVDKHGTKQGVRYRLGSKIIYGDERYVDAMLTHIFSGSRYKLFDRINRIFRNCFSG
jgi:hypothetical protein